MMIFMEDRAFSRATGATTRLSVAAMATACSEVEKKTAVQAAACSPKRMSLSTPEIREHPSYQGEGYSEETLSKTWNIVHLLRPVLNRVQATTD
jgi:hypothetical protein